MHSRIPSPTMNDPSEKNIIARKFGFSNVAEINKFVITDLIYSHFNFSNSEMVQMGQLPTRLSFWSFITEVTKNLNGL